jgi:hypothetical protein
VKNATDWHDVIGRWYSIDQPGQYPADPGNTGTGNLSASQLTE